ncbi:hypothetical protein AVEN_26284-1 [Araneus ventricosus]|uniref:Uncharacterized protein n=1 Tax=Araneus ventricosus TaxID=182803 RepID=A0A4Y2ALY3_ARAVE|nr:hypothetical protein AVEN_26284-1 [Araneus ventricosus]
MLGAMHVKIFDFMKPAGVWEVADLGHPRLYSSCPGGFDLCCSCSTGLVPRNDPGMLATPSTCLRTYTIQGRLGAVWVPIMFPEDFHWKLARNCVLFERNPGNIPAASPAAASNRF